MSENSQKTSTKSIPLFFLFQEHQSLLFDGAGNTLLSYY